MTNHTELVRQVKAELEQRGVSLVGPCGALEITERVAWALRRDGAGLLEKTTGNRCRDRAVDVVAFRDGSHFDCLIDSGGANTPAWQNKGPFAQDRWREPLSHLAGGGTDGSAGGLNSSVSPDGADPERLVRACATIVTGLEAIAGAIHELNKRLDAQQVNGVRVRL